MDSWRDELTPFEWIQMGALLVGLPSAAILGALLGLIGKWKQGRVVTAALVGLGGAAMASMIALVAFLIDSEISARRSSSDWIRLFDRYLSWRQTLIAIAAAGGMSFLAAVVLRLRPAKHTSATYSLRSLIAAQFLAMVVLGCWTGMRSYIFSHVPAVERAAHKWEKRGWMVVGSAPGGKFSLQRDFGVKPLNWKLESEKLHHAVREPWLGALHLLNLENADDFDFAAIADAPSLNRLELRYLPAITPPQHHIDTLAKMPSLRYLTIQGGDFSSLDVSAFQHLDSITSLEVRDCVFDIPQLRSAIRSLKPERFEVSQSTPDAKMPTKLGLLEDYHFIQLTDPIDAADLSWVDPSRIRVLQIDGPSITMEAAQAIAKMPGLISLALNCRVEGSTLFEVAKAPKLKSLYLLQMARPIDRELFDLAMKEVMLAPALGEVFCNWETFKPDLDFPAGSDGGIGWPGAAAPAYLRNLDRPPTQKQIDYLNQINHQRKERGLNGLKINSSDASGLNGPTG